VLNGSHHPITGLYACGKDMHSVMGGEYPGAGAQLGLAMTCGYLAAMHAAGAERATPLATTTQRMNGAGAGP
jgi:3-oxosteroid 1-dehydrogenase